MNEKLTCEKLTHSGDFELLQEVSLKGMKQFVIEQILSQGNIIKVYSNYQIIMLLFQAFFAIRAFISFFNGMPDALIQIGYALLFSFTVLIFIHELIHALTFLVLGIIRLRVGAIWRQFIFYVMTDHEVITSKKTQIAALAPLVVIKLLCLVGAVIFWNTSLVYFFFSVMCIHSLFCAGDMALLAFFNAHEDKEIYCFDDFKEGKSYFYYRKS